MARGFKQESVSGMVMFKIFINDLDEQAENSLIIFADDTHLGQVVNTLEN